MKYPFKNPIFKIYRESDQSISNDLIALSPIPITQATTAQNETLSSSNDIIKASKPKNNHKHSQKYICPECNKKLKSKVNYDRHMESHPRKEFYCKSCKVILYDKSELHAHIDKVHNFKCDHCRYCTSKEDKLIKHKLEFIRQISLSRFINCFKLFALRRKISQGRATHQENSEEVNRDKQRMRRKRRLIQRQKQLSKNQQVREVWRYDSSTDDDE